MIILSEINHDLYILGNFDFGPFNANTQKKT